MWPWRYTARPEKLFNRENIPVELNGVTRIKLSSPAGFTLAIHLYQSVSDEHLCFSA
jgi:hypothetical protein